MAVNEKEIEAIVKSVLDGMRDPSALAASTTTAMIPQQQIRADILELPSGAAVENLHCKMAVG